MPFSGQDRQEQQPRHRSGRRHEELDLLRKAEERSAQPAHRVLHLRAKHGRSKLSFPLIRISSNFYLCQ